MKKITSITLFFLLFALGVNAQQDKIYATMQASDAAAFKILYPTEMEILATENNQSAVLVSESVTHKLHDKCKDTRTRVYI